MSENTILEHRVKLNENKLDKLESKFDNHETQHQMVDKDMKNHGEEIAAMKAIMPKLENTLDETVKVVGTLNNTLIRIDEQTQANTQFRQRFTWKEIVAIAVGIATIASIVGQYWGGA